MKNVEERMYALGKIIEELSIMEENSFSEMMEEIELMEGNIFSYGLDEYLVLTEEEVYNLLKDRIQKSLWALNPSFLESVTGLPAEAFKELAEKCESGNDAVRALVDKTCGIDRLIERVTLSNRRGYFLADYDGVEHVSIIHRPDRDVVYYIYRLN